MSGPKTIIFNNKSVETDTDSQKVISEPEGVEQIHPLELAQGKLMTNNINLVEDTSWKKGSLRLKRSIVNLDEQTECTTNKDSISTKVQKHCLIKRDIKLC